MSKSGLFAHFKSKEAAAAPDARAGRASGSPTSSIRPALAAPRGETRVRALFDRWLRLGDRGLQGGCIFVTASVEFDDQPGPMRDAVVRRPAGLAGVRRHRGRHAVTEGDFRADLDTEQFAFTLQGLMLGYHHAARLMRDPKAREHARRPSTSCSRPAPPSSPPSSPKGDHAPCHAQEKHDRSFQERRPARLLPLRRSARARPRPGGPPATCGSRLRRGWPTPGPSGGGRSRSRRRATRSAASSGATARRDRLPGARVGRSRRQFGAMVAPLVEAGHRVVMFDAPAHGDSDHGPAGPGRTNGVEFAKALDAVFCRFGPAEAVVAHSMGTISTYLACATVARRRAPGVHRAHGRVRVAVRPVPAGARLRSSGPGGVRPGGGRVRRCAGEQSSTPASRPGTSMRCPRW